MALSLLTPARQRAGGTQDTQVLTADRDTGHGAICGQRVRNRLTPDAHLSCGAQGVGAAGVGGDHRRGLKPCVARNRAGLGTLGLWMIPQALAGWNEPRACDQECCCAGWRQCPSGRCSGVRDGQARPSDTQDQGPKPRDQEHCGEGGEHVDTRVAGDCEGTPGGPVRGVSAPFAGTMPQWGCDAWCLLCVRDGCALGLSVRGDLPL